MITTAVSTLRLGPAPLGERSAIAGVTADWLALQQLEAATYRAALVALHGLPPAGVHLPVDTRGDGHAQTAAIELRFPIGNPAISTYVDRIAAGLPTWMSANFTAPVLYDEHHQVIPGSRRTTEACVISALATCRMLIEQGYGTDRETTSVANLSHAFPTCARLAGALLHEAAGTA